jgi:hypothetical protein
MEKKTKVAKPAAPMQNPPDALTPEQLDKVVGGVGPVLGTQINHNQNVV